MLISAYINTPIPLFLKLFAMESGTIGCSGKLLCLPVRKGTVGHILNITPFHNERAYVCSVFVLRLIEAHLLFMHLLCIF